METKFVRYVPVNLFGIFDYLVHFMYIFVHAIMKQEAIKEPSILKTLFLAAASPKLAEGLQGSSELVTAQQPNLDGPVSAS